MSVFVTPFGIFHVYLLPAFFRNIVFVTLYFFDIAHSAKVSLISFLNSNLNLPVAVSIGFLLFLICALKPPITIMTSTSL